MSFQTLVFPKGDEEKMKTLGFEIVFACERLGVKVDTPRFLSSWAEGLRVLVEKDSADRIVSFAFLIAGQKWFDQTPTATILSMAGDTDKMIEYAKNVASIIGVEWLFYTENNQIETPDGYKSFIHKVRVS